MPEDRFAAPSVAGQEHLSMRTAVHSIQSMPSGPADANRDPADSAAPDRDGLRNFDTTVSCSQVQLLEIASAVAFKAARPRLVIANDALCRIVNIDAPEWTVGRQKSGGAATLDCALAHPSISGHHARIRAVDRRFFIEDLGSVNHTYVGTEMLAPQAPRELAPDTWIRFGTVDALFVVDVDHEGHAIDPSRHDETAGVLLRERAVTRGQLARARRDVELMGVERLHVGEALLSAGIITVRQWVQAAQRGEFVHLAHLASDSENGVAKRLFGFTVHVIAATAVALVLLRVFGVIRFGGE